MSMNNNHQTLKEYAIFVFPILLLFVGIGAFFRVIPITYTNAISLIDWLFSGSDNIISTLHDVNTVMGKLQRIIFMRAFWALWFIFFSISVFFLGKHIHNKKENYSVNAELKGKEAYDKLRGLIIKNYKKLRATEYITLNKKLDALAEKLNYESNFGYGDLIVIECENQINKKINDLEVLLMDYEPSLDNKKNVELVLDEINILLDQRAEMKKRHKV